MSTQFDTVLDKMEATAHLLSTCVPRPQKIQLHGDIAYRYVEKSLHQAIVQKLVRYVSGLRAACVLLENGFVQEQAALQRMLDEIQEDIAFLSYSVIFGDFTPLHASYLDAFYEEEFDSVDAVSSTQKRAPIPRRKIRAHLARYSDDPSRAVDVSRTVSKLYSGYVHAASPHIMDLYWGSPPTFHMMGMRGTIRQDEHRQDLWNCFYRGLIAFGEGTKAFGLDEVSRQITDFSVAFAKQNGKDYSS